MVGRDPIQAAGIRWCTVCRAEAWPVDAAWLAPDLILATFEPLCGHNPEARNMVVTPSQLETVAGRCAGVTMAGADCRARPQHGSRYCRHHDPMRQPGKGVRR